MGCIKSLKKLFKKKDKKKPKVELPSCISGSTNGTGLHSFHFIDAECTRVSDLPETVYKEGNIHLVVHSYQGSLSGTEIKDIYVVKGNNVSEDMEKMVTSYAKGIPKEKKSKKFTCTLTTVTKETEPSKFTEILERYNELLYKEQEQSEQQNPEDPNLNITQNNSSISSSSSSSSSKKGKAKQKIQKDDSSIDSMTQISLDSLQNYKSNKGLTAWIITSDKIVQKPQDKLKSFYSSEVNLYLNSYGGSDGEQHEIYIWNGTESSAENFRLAFSYGEKLREELENVTILSKESLYYQSQRFKKLLEFMFVNRKGSSLDKFYNEEPKVIHVSGDKKFVLARCKSFNINYLTSDDCYVIEQENHLYQFIGQNSNKDERYNTGIVAQHLKDYKKNTEITIIDEAEDKREAEILKKIPILDKKEFYDRKYIPQLQNVKQISADKKSDSKLQKFDSNECYMIDLKSVFFLWIGNSAEKRALRKGLKAFKKFYLEGDNKHTVGQIVREGKETEEFNDCSALFVEKQ